MRTVARNLGISDVGLAKTRSERRHPGPAPRLLGLKCILSGHAPLP